MAAERRIAAPVSNITPARSSAIMQRAEILDDINPALRDELVGIMTRIKGHVENTVRFYYWLGTRVNVLRDNPDKYGGKVVEKASDVLKFSEYVLYKSGAFAKLYTPEQLDAFCNLRIGGDGPPLTWGHAVALLVIKDGKQREALQRRAADEALTVEALEDLVKKLTNGKQRPGKQFSELKTVHAGLLQIRETAEAYIKRHTSLWAGGSRPLFDWIATMPPEKMTAELREEIAAANDRQRTLLEKVTADVAQTQKLLKQVDKVLAKRAPEEAPTKGQTVAAAASNRRAAATTK